MLRSQHETESAPQQIAAPQRSNESPSLIHYVLVIIIFAMVMDFWFDIEAGMNIPQMIVRHLAWLLSREGR